MLHVGCFASELIYMAIRKGTPLPIVNPEFVIIILELQSGEGPYGSPGSALVEEAQCGIELPVSGSTGRCLNY